MRILSLNIRGESEVLVSAHREEGTCFNKRPVTDDRIYLGMEGFAGDAQHHRDVHGGNDKAVCCYGAQHFPYWKEKAGIDLMPSAFGENLTLDHADEHRICIGDRYRLGESLVEVSEPRGPCYIIGIRYHLPSFPVWMRECGFTGFYLRTLEPGEVGRNDDLVPVYRHPDRISVMDVNRARYQDVADTELLRKLSVMPELTAEWREKFRSRLP